MPKRGWMQSRRGAPDPVSAEVRQAVADLRNAKLLAALREEPGEGPVDLKHLGQTVQRQVLERISQALAAGDTTQAQDLVQQALADAAKTVGMAQALKALAAGEGQAAATAAPLPTQDLLAVSKAATDQYRQVADLERERRQEAEAKAEALEEEIGQAVAQATAKKEAEAQNLLQMVLQWQKEQQDQRAAFHQFQIELLKNQHEDALKRFQEAAQSTIAAVREEAQRQIAAVNDAFSARLETLRLQHELDTTRLQAQHQLELERAKAPAGQTPEGRWQAGYVDLALRREEQRLAHEAQAAAKDLEVKDAIAKTVPQIPAALGNLASTLVGLGSPAAPPPARNGIPSTPPPEDPA